MSDTPQRPTPGRIVHYQTDGRNGFDYWLPALVTITADDNWVPGDGTVPMPETAFHCHLNVFGPNGTYVEHNVPWSPEGNRRSWRWPERFTSVAEDSGSRPFSRGEDPTEQGPFKSTES